MNRSEGIADVYINDQQAQNSLKTLEAQASKLNGKLTEMRKANDKLGYDKTAKELKTVQKEMKQYQQRTLDVTKVLNNLSGTTYNNLVKAQKQLRKEVKNMSRATKEEQAAYKAKTRQLAAIDTELTKVQKDMKITTKGSLDLRGALVSMGLPLDRLNKLTEIQSVVQGKLTAATAGSTKAMKFLRIALISTGIGAIAVAVGTLATALFTTQRGTDALNKVLIPLQTIFQKIVGIVQDVGLGLMDAFTNPKQAINDLWQLLKSQIVNRISGVKDTFISLGRVIQSALKFDWDGVKENAKDFGNAYMQTLTGVKDVTSKVASGIRGLGTDIKAAAKEGQRLAEIKVELEELAIAMARDEAKLNRTFEEQRTILNDVNVSEAERLQAGKAAIQANKTIKDMKLAELELLIEEQQIKMKQNDSDREAELELANLQAQRDSFEATHIKDVMKLKNKLNSLSKAGMDAIKKELESLAGFEQEIIQKIGNDLQAEIDQMDLTIEPDIAFDEEKTDENLQGFVDAYNEAQNMISQYNAQSTWDRLEVERQAIEKARSENLITESQYQAALNNINARGIQLRIGVLQDFTTALESMFKKGSEAGQVFAVASKALASAQAIISTYQAASLALASAPPPWNFIQMGAVIAAGLANVMKINSVQFAKGKYDVIGGSDGRVYRAGYSQRASTGIYSTPTLVGGLGLVGERAPEMVVDGPTLSNIQMNAPQIIEAIHAMRVPQFASGNYPTPPTTSTPNNAPNYEAQLSEMAGMMGDNFATMIELLKRSNRAHIVYSDIEDAQAEINEIKNSVTK